MMTYTFTKEVNADRLMFEIKSTALATSFVSITTMGEDVSIVFAEELSSANETILNDLVDAHTNVPMPGPVTPRQMKQALVLSGVTLQQIEDALNSLSEPTRSLAKIEWEYSLEFQRTRPIVASVGAMLGWSSQQLDSLWAFAATL